MRTLAKISDSDKIKKLEARVALMMKGITRAGFRECCRCGEVSTPGQVENSVNPAVLTVDGKSVCLDCILGDENFDGQDWEGASVKAWSDGLIPLYSATVGNYLGVPFWNTQGHADSRASKIADDMRRGVAKFQSQPACGDALIVVLEIAGHMRGNIIRRIIAMGGCRAPKICPDPQDWTWCSWIGQYLLPEDMDKAREAWRKVEAEGVKQFALGK